jgi:tetratricopeptide (TPR) repeat protein
LIKKILFATSLFVIVSAPLTADTDPKYKNISRQLVAEAMAAFDTDKKDDARLLFERALVADPANTHALIGLGKTYEAQGRVGRGLKYYRLALEIEPNDQNSLKIQALAFLKREMLDRADANRAKLVRLCPKGCAALEKVETALEAYLAQPETTQKTAEAPSP